MRAMLAYLLCYDVLCVRKKKGNSNILRPERFFLLLLFSLTPFSMTALHNREATWNESGIFVRVFDSFIGVH